MRFPLSRQDFSIGRTEDNDLVLDNPLVSRQDARLHMDGRGVWIMDLNSSNGILVNNARIQPGQWVLLSADATIQIGQSTLRLESVFQSGLARRTSGRRHSRIGCNNYA